MRVILVALAVFAAVSASCTKRNENLCCIDEADCNQIGEPVEVPCNDGLVCRGNLCIAIACASNADCDATAPFCDTVSGRCEEACETDDQCPGLGSDPSLTVCEAGTCLECRGDDQCSAGLPVCASNMCVECDDDSQCSGPVGACENNQCIECRDDSQCEGNRPICDGNACRACIANDECASGVCSTNGECVGEDQISHVAPAGTAIATCSASDPCSLERGLQLVASRPYILLASGDYTGTGEYVLGENGHLIGDPTSLPTLRNGSDNDYSVVRIASGADVVIENVRIGDARSPLQGVVANGIACSVPAKLVVRNLELFNNRSLRFGGAGIYASGCQVEVYDSRFTENKIGVHVSGAVVEVERSTFLKNVGGVWFESGNFEIRNSIVARSVTVGLDINEHVGTVVEFNTIVDNPTGVECEESEFQTLALANNVLARNSVNITGTKCTSTTSLVLPGVAGLNFVRPDLEPYDYHIGPGSSAIDQATDGGDVMLDIDRQPRPATGRDLGADEFQ
jgi:hypothetical protein